MDLKTAVEPWNKTLLLRDMQSSHFFQILEGKILRLQIQKHLANIVLQHYQLHHRAIFAHSGNFSFDVL